MEAAREPVPNVLAERYASETLKDLWSPRGKILLERELWIAVLKAQRALGREVPGAAIEAYEAALETIDLEAIRRREAETRHDVKARLEAFNALAGHELIHQGMTSRDLTESVEQLQLYRSLRYLRDLALKALQELAARAEDARAVPLTARTHNVPAQVTTVGRRWAMFGEELLEAWQRLDALVQRYPARGLKGAVGTQLDALTLLGGDAARVEALEARVAEHLGLPRVLQAPGQVYPRSLDAAVVSALLELCSGPSSLAKTLRLMAGAGLASEGFAPGQTGSSAMPHKVNARTCERINGFKVILQGHLAMAAALAGDQWNEGDVSCSVVRRVLLPDACFACDGLLRAFRVVLAQLELYPAALHHEVETQLPFLATTTLLMEAVKAGAGRERAHAVLKEHALHWADALRQGAAVDPAGELAADARLPLDRPQIDTVLAATRERYGRALEQVDAFVAAVATLEPGPDFGALPEVEAIV